MANDARVTLRESLCALSALFALSACSERSAQSAAPKAKATSHQSLKVHALEPEGAQHSVFLLHGYGAAGDDLLPIARMLSQATPYRYIVAEAPHERAEGGRAWWPIDFAAQRPRFEQGRGLDLRNEDPSGLPLAREKLQRLVEATREANATRSQRVAVVGFSQGAMLALDFALEADRPPECVGLLSGTLLRESAWRKRLEHTAGFDVFISHGTEDTILPFALSDELQRTLRARGLATTFVPFSGGHSIPRAVVAKLQAFLMQCLGS